MMDQVMFQQMMANAQQFQNFQNQFQQFVQQIQGGPQSFNGQQQVQNMLANGQMSQADFERVRQQANQIMGVNY